jgi:hypothetical protein
VSDEVLNFAFLPPKSSREIVILDAKQFAELEQEHKELREIVEAIFIHPMVSEVHACRECGKPIIHMEHLSLEKAQAVMTKAYALLGIKDGDDEEEL